MVWTEFSCVLGPSQISGIGVFTTHDISKGVKIFSGTHSTRKLNVKDVPDALLKYCIFLNDEECIGPERFDRMELGWYLNHSSNPNVSVTPDKRLTAMRHIKAGEELLLDYNELNEPEHLKEAYYQTTLKK